MINPFKIFKTAPALLLTFSLLSIIGCDPAENKTFSNPTIQACFTPGEDCTKKIVDAIQNAKQTVLIQAYSFTSAAIAKAVVDARNRHIDVRVILDKSQKTQKYSSSHFLLAHDVPTWIDYKPAIAHNKIIIIDDEQVITGSFNFTKAAQEKNAENLLFINNLELAQRYRENWESRKRQSIVLSKSLN